MTKLFTKRQVRDASQQRGALLRSYVLVYRERIQTGTPQWTGPLILLDLNESTATFLGHSGPQSFRLSLVKRYFDPIPTSQEHEQRVKNQPTHERVQLATESVAPEDSREIADKTR